MSFPHISSVPTHKKDEDKHEGELEGLGKSNGILPPEKVPVKVGDVTTTVATTQKTPSPVTRPLQGTAYIRTSFPLISGGIVYVAHFGLLAYLWQRPRKNLYFATG